VVFRRGDRRFDGRTAREAIADVRQDPECLMVNRNRGSGTRALIDRLLDGARPAGYAVQPRNHHAVAAAVAQGRADWGMTLDIVARRAALGFLPVQEEHFDFAVPKSRAHRPGVAAFKALLQEPRVREARARLGMTV
jgi:putative molybdopterin biosynthesis protein